MFKFFPHFLNSNVLRTIEKLKTQQHVMLAVGYQVIWHGIYVEAIIFKLTRVLKDLK
jgi:hypothetical protein